MYKKSFITLPTYNQPITYNKAHELQVGSSKKNRRNTEGRHLAEKINYWAR